MTASNLIALGLGVLSLVLAVYPEVKRWRASRRAGVSIMLENYQRPDTGRMQARFVITNHGPAVAWNVAIEDFDTFRVSEWSPVNDNAHPVRVMQPGQRHAILWDQGMSQRTPGAATVSWRDPSGEHREQYAISPHYL